MSKYSQNLAGLNAQGFVSPAVAYTAQTTYEDFLRNAVEGEMGVFLEDGTLKTTALTAGQVYFIAQKRGGVNSDGATELFVHRTPNIEFDKSAFAKTAYDAPAKQITAVGWNGTSGSLNIDLSLPGTQELVISARATTPANQPFPVEEGRGISVRTTDEEYAILAQVVNDINGTFDYERNEDDTFVIAEILSNGAVTLTDLPADVTVTNGDVVMSSAGHLLNVGDYVSLDGAVYKVTAAAAPSFSVDRPWAADSGTVLAANAGSIAYVDGTTELGVRLTGVDIDTHFVVSVQDELEGADISALQAWKQGSGSGESIVRFENEAIIFSGVGSTINAMLRDDYGQPTRFASRAATYDQYFIDIAQRLQPSAGAPVPVTEHLGHVIIAAPSGGTSPTTQLTTVFGV